MKERPIIVTTELIPKLLDGTKTQTRRVLKPQPSPNSKIVVRGLTNSLWWQEFDGYYEDAPPRMFKCPYGQVGDRLWVRETWVESRWGVHPELIYKADGIQTYIDRWQSPIFMPRWASRITLEITKVRVERLQEITLDDAIKEGFGSIREFNETFLRLNPKLRTENPWVWVIEWPPYRRGAQ